MKRRYLLLAAVVVIGAAAVWFGSAERAPLAKAGGPFSPPGAIHGSIAVEVPGSLGDEASRGAEAYAANCAACHGDNGAGSDHGPPLVHVIYEPNHHGDGAFFSAVRGGARAHHWRYGDMPPVAVVSDADLTAIVTYIRELQRANGVR